MEGSAARDLPTISTPSPTCNESLHCWPSAGTAAMTSRRSCTATGSAFSAGHGAFVPIESPQEPAHARIREAGGIHRRCARDVHLDDAGRDGFVRGPRRDGAFDDQDPLPFG